jgi:segregation and condensation protein B
MPVWYHPLRRPLLGPELRRSVHQLPRNFRPVPHARQSSPRPVEPGAAGPLARTPQLAQVEAALVVADEPLTARKLASAAGLPDGNEARRLVRKLQELYELGGSAFQIEELAGGYQLFTRAVFHRWLMRLSRSNSEPHLTGPARETLAIVAYRQPITRADVESVRGVQCGNVLQLLMEKGLVRIVGRHDSLGRPVLYGTTRKFLQVFGMRNLKDLPDVS